MSDGETEVRHRSKKDTKSWCRGKEGVEHELETVLDDWPYGIRALEIPCGWHLMFMRGDYARRPRVSWSCRHLKKCVVCGKKFDQFRLKEDCPNFHPAPEGDVWDWPCQECSHALGVHGNRTEPCVDGCECSRFWLYPKGKAER